MEETAQKISQIVNEYLQAASLQDLADEISLPAHKITFTRSAVWNWKNGKAVDTDRIAQVARFGHTERAREFARRILAAKGLQLL